ncbi:MAG: DUF1003 domain-containing protein [Deltaproteobacteria bacterium]|nr:DUF1003 domain-containing protein [Deltaproteobacteria bacterium]
MSGALDRWHKIRIRHQHSHAPIRNVNDVDIEGMTFGQRAADGFAKAVGSWTFIVIQSVILAFWITLNIIAWIDHWDPYPFILLNLALSFQAAYAAPILMMSQNRQATKDRLMAEQDYLINTKAEEELKAVMHHLETQDDLMLDILRRLEEQHNEMLVKIGVDTGQSSPAPTTAPPSK